MTGEAGNQGVEIAVSQLDFAYAGNSASPVFRDVDITFRSGRLSAVVGTSGAGKSTLLKLLGALLSPHDQSRPITYGPDKLPADVLASRGAISICFQKPACLPWLSVYDNVTIGLRLKGRCHRETDALALLNRFGLADRSADYPHSLSLGMQARVALARAFVTQPTIVLLDEPFSSLDVRWKEEIYGYLLNAVREAGCTTVLVTHDLPEALCLADDVFSITGSPARIEAILADNPLRHLSAPVSLRRLLSDSRFSGFYARIYDALPTQTRP